MLQVNSTYRHVRIIGIRQETIGVKTFLLEYDDGSQPSYEAGQFITFVFDNHGREERRSYSFSSSPGIEEKAAITVKRIDNGAFSRQLIDNARIGDLLVTTIASGLFTIPLEAGNEEQVFFFAAGIGITPVFSLIKTLLQTRPGLPVVLAYSNRSIEDTVFYNELNDLARQFAGRFKIQYLFSSAFNLSRARLNKALIPVLISEYGLVPKEKMHFYLCGPFTYMRMALMSLEETGVKDEQVKRENFNADNRPAINLEPPDKDTHMAYLNWNGENLSFNVNYPDTLLKAARKKGYIIPFSCETGRCGSCAAQCTKGNVWLSYNEVLTDADIRHGKILTCTGHPVGGDVWIEI